MSSHYLSAEFKNVRLPLDKYLDLIRFDGQLPLVIDDDWLSQQLGYADLAGMYDSPLLTLKDGVVHVEGQWSCDEAGYRDDEFLQALVQESLPGGHAEFYTDEENGYRWRRVKEEDGTVMEHQPMEVWPTDGRLGRAIEAARKAQHSRATRVGPVSPEDAWLAQTLEDLLSLLDPKGKS